MRRLLALPAALVLGAACSEDTMLPPADTVAPAFTVSHEQNATNQRTATIAGMVADSVGVARVTFRVNGGAEQPVAITPGPVVSFSASVPAAAALNTVEFAAYDAAGNRGSETMELRYDTTPPEVSVGSLSNGGKFSSFFRIDGGATDASGVRRAAYSVNGGAEQSMTGGHYSSSPGVYAFRSDLYGLPLGENNLVVYVYDRAGNRAQLQGVITRVE